MGSEIVKRITETLRNEVDHILPDAKDELINILYIDDEVSNLTSFKAVFRRNKSLNIYLAENLEEGLSVLAKNSVNILFTDYKMPITDGEEVVRCVSLMYPRIVPIVLSAYLDTKTRQRFKKSFNDILMIEKPFKSEELLNIINYKFAEYHV